MERRSIGEYLGSFLQRGQQHAYVQRRGYRTARWTYRQIAELAFRCARELANRGIAKGERVLIWGPNSAEWVAAFFGCALRGVIVVPMDDAAAPEFALRVAQKVSTKLLVCSREHAQNGLPTLLLDDLQEVLGRHSAAPYNPVPVETSDPLEIVFTSGTTAEPKGVVISHGNVLGNVTPLEEEIRKYLKYERFVHPVRFLNLLPLSHVFGQFLGIFLPQLMGGTVIFQDTLKPADVISSIHREHVSVLAAVPRILQSLKEKIELDLEEDGQLNRFRETFRSAEGKHFLRRWWIFRRVHRQFGWKFWAFISGGAALDRATEEFWGRLGFAVIQGYGLTETTSLISVNHPFRLGKGSIGKVLAGREVKLSPENEILVRGSSVASGYWNGQELQPVAPEEDFPRTSTQKPRTNVILQAVQTDLASKSAAGSSPLAELLSRVTGRNPGELRADANLENDLNLSSLDRVELFGALEDRYQMDLSETQFTSVKTVGDLEAMLRGKPPARVRYHYPRWAQRWPVTWIRLLTHYLLMRPAVFLLGWPRIEGRENLRGVRGPVLVICNHIGDVDVGFVQTALPARIRHELATAAGGEALEILRSPPPERAFFGKAYDRVKWALGVSLLNLFPLPREAGFRESFAYAGESADRGYSVLVFPEGHHTTDAKLHGFTAGLGLLATNLPCAVVPLRIDGLFELKQAGKKLACPWQVKVKIGSPIRFASDSDPQWIAQELQKAVEQL